MVEISYSRDGDEATSPPKSSRVSGDEGQSNRTSLGSSFPYAGCRPSKLEGVAKLDNIFIRNSTPSRSEHEK